MNDETRKLVEDIYDRLTLQSHALRALGGLLGAVDIEEFRIRLTNTVKEVFARIEI